MPEWVSPNHMTPGQPTPVCSTDDAGVNAEIARLHKIINALMDRAEHSAGTHSTDFSLFQTAIELEEQVQRRTEALENALRENEKINRALGDSEARFRGLVSQSLLGIFIFEKGRLSYTNAKFNEIFGYSEAEIREHHPLDFVALKDRQQVVESMRKILHGERELIESLIRGVRKNGEVIHVEFHASVMDTGGNRALICLVMDVSERIRAEHNMQALQNQLREQSTHDALTGLYNRRFLDETLGRELLLAERHGHTVSVIMGDLDHFKKVNDRFGHLAGDEVLRAFGAILKQNARGSDVYCRYGGEEFLLVLPLMAQVSAFERAEQLRLAMQAAPVAYGASLIAVTASFGVATFPKDGHTGDALIAAADHALYEAKEAGRNCVRVCAGPASRPGGSP